MHNTHHRAPQAGLSYYGLSLLSYLRESHPDLTDDADFIRTRAQAAAETYSRVIRSGSSRAAAEAAASETLFRGLHFSPCDTLVHVLRNEFADIVPDEEARRGARLMLPLLRDVLAGYDFADDFAASPQYDLFYTELTGAVQILLEDGVQ